MKTHDLLYSASSERNKIYFKEIEDFAQDVDLGHEHPFIVLEKIGLWYTNM